MDEKLCIFCEPYSLICWYDFEPWEQGCAIDLFEHCEAATLGNKIAECPHYTTSAKEYTKKHLTTA